MFGFKDAIEDSNSFYSYLPKLPVIYSLIYSFESYPIVGDNIFT